MIVFHYHLKFKITQLKNEVHEYARFTSRNDFALNFIFISFRFHAWRFFLWISLHFSFLVCQTITLTLKVKYIDFSFLTAIKFKKNIQQNKIFSHEAWELLKLPKYVLSKLKLMLKPNTIQDNCLHFNTLLYYLDGDNDHSIILVYINITSNIFVQLMSISMNNQINFFKYNFQSKLAHFIISRIIKIQYFSL